MYFFSFAHEKCVLKMDKILPETASMPYFYPAEDVHLTEKDALRRIKKTLEAQIKEFEERHFKVSEKLASAIMKEIRQDSASPSQ